MPIVRKIFEIGNSKAVTIPKSWLEYFEKEKGVRIEKVAIEVNGVLKVKPVLEKPK
jgi:antitoxin component of MazEF toxin-antitoxin module